MDKPRGARRVNLSRNRFERLVRRALTSLPGEFQSWLQTVVVVIENEPPQDMSDTLGLYEGTPLIDRSSGDIALPDQITIFKELGVMHVKTVLAMLSVALVIVFVGSSCTPTANESSTSLQVTQQVIQSIIKLPEPRLESNASLEETLLNRRSIREYSSSPLTFGEVSQLLWAAQGLTAEWGGRTAPSAGGLYPLEIYLAAGSVVNLAPGIYKYKPEGHELIKLRDGDEREELAKAALNQTWVKAGAINIVVAAVYERTTKKYGDRGVRYVDMEAGHAAQNLYLQATALDLGMVTVAAFNDEQVRRILDMLTNETPLYVIPVGKKKT